MKHSVNELYRDKNKVVKGYFTKGYAEANGMTNIGGAHYISTNNKGYATINTEHGKKVIWLYGEKTFFDTEEERDEYRAMMNEATEKARRRNAMLKKIMAHYEAMTDEELEKILEEI